MLCWTLYHSHQSRRAVVTAIAAVVVAHSDGFVCAVACRAADDPRWSAAFASVQPHDAHALGSTAGTDRPPSLCRCHRPCIVDRSNVIVHQLPCIDGCASLHIYRCVAVESGDSPSSSPSHGTSVATSPGVRRLHWRVCVSCCTPCMRLPMWPLSSSLLPHACH
jgi:hypothetical protein